MDTIEIAQDFEFDLHSIEYPQDITIRLYDCVSTGNSKVGICESVSSDYALVFKVLAGSISKHLTIIKQRKLQSGVMAHDITLNMQFISLLNIYIEHLVYERIQYLEKMYSLPPQPLMLTIIWEKVDIDRNRNCKNLQYTRVIHTASTPECPFCEQQNNPNATACAACYQQLV